MARSPVPTSETSRSLSSGRLPRARSAAAPEACATGPRSATPTAKSAAAPPPRPRNAAAAPAPLDVPGPVPAGICHAIRGRAVANVRAIAVADAVAHAVRRDPHRSSHVGRAVRPVRVGHGNSLPRPRASPRGRAPGRRPRRCRRRRAIRRGAGSPAHPTAPCRAAGGSRPRSPARYGAGFPRRPARRCPPGTHSWPGWHPGRPAGCPASPAGRRTVPSTNTRRFGFQPVNRGW